MATTYSVNKDLALPGTGDAVGTWGTILNGNFSIIDAAFGGTTTITLSNANVTLTQVQVEPVRILLTGTVTTSLQVIFPAGISGFFIVQNTTTQGSNVITLSNAVGGTTVTASANSNTFVFVDGSSGATKGVSLASPSAVTAGTGISIVGSTVNLATPVSVANGGTGQTSFTNGQLLIGNTTTGGLTPAALTAGTNISITNTPGNITISAGATGGATTYTSLQTFLGTTSNLAALLTNAGETVTILGSVPSSPVSFNVTSQSIGYVTANATANWTLAITASSTTTLNSIMSVGQSVTISYLQQCGGTAYYNNAVTIDGSSVTPVWQSNAPTAGYASSLNVYTYTIIKTSTTPTWTVLATLTPFY
jgi:hypothetical protein